LNVTTQLVTVRSICVGDFVDMILTTYRIDPFCQHFHFFSLWYSETLECRTLESSVHYTGQNHVWALKK